MTVIINAGSGPSLKYTYICFMKSNGGSFTSEEEKQWNAGHKKACEEYKVKMHTFGVVYGVVEEYVGV